MPTPGDVLGFMLDTLFTDQIDGDLERIERSNELVRAAPQAPGLRPIDTLLISPSVDPSEIAARHVSDMPGGLRALLRVLGGRPELPGHQLTSYLAFEASYTRALIQLGYRDAMRARTALRAFVAGERLQAAPDAAGVTPIT
jgi:NTE family protein